MSTSPYFPSLDGFGPTRATLHLYSQALGAVARAHGIAHPKWWHISLKLRADGLTTDPLPLPGGGILTLRLDLLRHTAVLETSVGDSQTWDLTAGLTGTQFGDAVTTAVGAFGLDGPYAREKFVDDAPRIYDTAVVGRYFRALVNAGALFTQHRAGLDGVTSPVQVWPHGFDLAFDWFGTRVETFEEHGTQQRFTAQLNLGFYPGANDAESYFYSNPWPFEAGRLLDQPLPAGARWHTQGWQGTILPYGELADDPDAAQRLLAYATAVYRIASPTLLA